MKRETTYLGDGIYAKHEGTYIVLECYGDRISLIREVQDNLVNLIKFLREENIGTKNAE